MCCTVIVVVVAAAGRTGVPDTYGQGHTIRRKTAVRFPTRASWHPAGGTFAVIASGLAGEEVHLFDVSLQPLSIAVAAGAFR